MVYLLSILDISKTLDNNPIFETQVLSLANYLTRTGHKVYLVGSYFDINVLNEKLDLSNNMVVLCYYHRNRYFNLFRQFVNVSKVCSKVDVFYARGIWGFVPLLPIQFFLRLFEKKKFFFNYDVRGDILDESDFMGSKNYSLKIKKLLERICITNANGVYTVSSYLSSLIAQRHGLLSLPKVIPSCIDLKDFGNPVIEKTLIRSKLGFSDSDILIVFSSGLGSYQLVSDVINLCDKLNEINNKIKLLLFIDGLHDNLSIHLNVVNNKNIVLRGVKRNELISILPVCDAGILYRSDRILNRVASPVKFSEYIAGGLAPIVTNNVGDVSDYVASMKYGYVLDVNNINLLEIIAFLENIKLMRNESIAESRQLAEKIFSWQAYHGRLYNNS